MGVPAVTGSDGWLFPAVKFMMIKRFYGCYTK